MFQDTNTIEEIRELQREIKETVQSREAGAATCIRGLTAEVNVSQAAVDALPAAEEADKSRKVALEGEKGETEEALVAMNKKIADTRQNVECMTVEAEEVEEKAKGIEHASQDQAPRVLHALSLYANITGIRWKYDDGEKSHLIRGCKFRGGNAVGAETERVSWIEWSPFHDTEGAGRASPVALVCRRLI